MEFYLKALGSFNSTSCKELTSKFKRIEALKEQLVSEGYQPSETDHFLKMAAGSAKISEMDNTQLDLIIEKLEAQIKIAQKCKELFK